jgi:hypothetical protein
MLPIVVSAAVSDGWTTPLLVVGWYIVLELVLNNIVEPLLYGNSIGVSAVGIIVAAIFWTWLWGPIGLVLAMPLTVCLVVTAHYVPQLRFVTGMLGDEPALSPAERTYQRLLAMDDDEALKLAKQYLKSGTRPQYYDEVLLPALALAERDRHASLLSDEQESFVDEAAEDLVEELAPDAEREEAGGDDSEKHDPPTGANGTKESADPPVRVLCLPLRDRADHTMTMMLAQLLAADGLHVDVGSIDSLTNERVDEAARLNSQIAVISIVPPCSPRSSRLLGRRLHQRYPDLPVIVSYWSAVRGERLQQRFDLNEPDRLTINLAEAIAAVKREARRIANHAARPREATTAASY